MVKLNTRKLQAVLPWALLVVRVYVGWQWLEAGWAKVHSPMWLGGKAGSALVGFLQGALAKTAGAHPDVAGWYGTFLKIAVVPHVTFWSNAVALGETAVGIGLILGAFTTLAAFFGVFMNFNYLLAGTVSVNPQLLALGIVLIVARHAAGAIGVDRWLVPALARRARRHR